jgi:crotonobetainyl-CoA:carnitine CoA-transferase CaiB-like acyl-CoA transferase
MELKSFLKLFLNTIKVLTVNKVVLDFSTRLPGPRATQNLLELGFEVIKVEDIDHPDQFSVAENEQFNYWYKDLNQKKEVLKVDFKTYNFTSLLEKAGIVLMGLSPSVAKKYKLDFDSLKKQKISYVEIDASTPLHDLNLLAKNKFFQLFLESSQSSQRPPFIPMMGLEFSSYITQKILGSYINLMETNLTQYNVLKFEEILPRLNFLNKIQFTPILHNGDLPCYYIYRSRDGDSIAFAAVEAKFWNIFTQKFKLNLSTEDRFDITGKITKKLETFFLSLSSSEISKVLGNDQVCINLIKKE